LSSYRKHQESSRIASSANAGFFGAIQFHRSGAEKGDSDYTLAMQNEFAADIELDNEWFVGANRQL